jgi:hypothetical protein
MRDLQEGIVCIQLPTNADKQSSFAVSIQLIGAIYAMICKQFQTVHKYLSSSFPHFFSPRFIIPSRFEFTFTREIQQNHRY